jgi:hypothetical protein
MLKKKNNHHLLARISTQNHYSSTLSFMKKRAMGGQTRRVSHERMIC